MEPKHQFEEGIAVNYSAEGDPEVAALEEESDKGSRLDRIELQTRRRIKPLAKWAWKEEKYAALQTFAATRNEIMHPPVETYRKDSTARRTYFPLWLRILGFDNFQLTRHYVYRAST